LVYESKKDHSFEVVIFGIQRQYTARSMTKKGRIEAMVRDTYLEISIQVLKNIYVIVPLIISAIVWAYGLTFIVDKVFQSYRTLIEMGIAGMLFFWLILGGLIFSTLYWIFFGRERIIVTEDTVQVEKPIHLYRRRRVYPTDQISRIRVAHELFKVRRNGEWEDDRRPVLQFETPFKQVTFGRGLKPEEAEFILLELARSPFLSEDQFEPISLT
jgi:hypothetical protein